MRKYLRENALRFIITNIAFAFISYTLLLSGNSAVPGSVDKAEAARTITSILILILNASFVATYALTKIVSKIKINLFLRMISDTAFFLILFWTVYLFIQ